MQIATKATTAPNVKGCETHNNNRDDNREKRWLMIHINDNIGCSVQVFSQTKAERQNIVSNCYGDELQPDVSTTPCFLDIC